MRTLPLSQLTSLIWAASVALNMPLAHAMVNPELESVTIAKRLKPITDEQWSQIAGEKIKEKYKIVQGDSLYGISKQLFGDGKYWPKLWALNNSTVLNAHLIYPNNELIFEAGTGVETPNTTIAANPEAPGSPATQTAAADVPAGETASDAPGTMIRSNGRSQEWRKMPRQPWEREAPKQNIAEISSIEKNRVIPEKRQGFFPNFMVASDDVEPIAEVRALRSYATSLNLDDLVFLEAYDDNHLDTEKEYAILGEPTKLSSAFSSRKGLAYPIVAVIKIDGTKEGLFVGRVTRLTNFGQRGAMVVPLPPRMKLGPYIPSDKEDRAVVMMNSSTTTHISSANRFVYLDRGTSDGVQVNNVFRIYATKDPATDKRYTKANFVYSADIVVTQTSERMSMGFVLYGVEPVLADSVAVLLTNVDDLSNKKRFREKVINLDTSTEPSGVTAPEAPADDKDLDAVPTAPATDDSDLDLDDDAIEKEVRKQEDEALDEETQPKENAAPKVEEDLDSEMGTPAETMPEAPATETPPEGAAEEGSGKTSKKESPESPTDNSELDDIPE